MACVSKTDYKRRLRESPPEIFHTQHLQKTPVVRRMALFLYKLFARETKNIQCMLLGLISGDYETLRRAGLSWRHLIGVHNLGSLVAWGSSVLVAVGAAITTLLTSEGCKS